MKEYWVNVYLDRLGYNWFSKERAMMYASPDIIYRIHVRIK